jgi:hypothetical protein
MVRATFRMWSRGRPESPNQVMAFSNNFSPSAVMAQNLRIMLDDICAFE